jgi:hypothetical protein
MSGGGTGFIDLPGEQKEVGTDWDKEEGWKQECCGAGDLVLIHGMSFEQRPTRLHLNSLKTSQAAYSTNHHTICRARPDSSIHSI